ncbi:cyd operon YbgE family protein [Algiphilus sp. W345]|uniref:Cyd operon YbgE family protein n=1 Tax=Banduia mediterranea TaxID=3075609 RepID=A0ABU2WHC7_9GAMM|nr:cyd operon YbgE family protein [Algiphilus sp. W345]MDT0497270.1 cyd operon YbgE family protein [Algiphilus sp. W345]
MNLDVNEAPSQTGLAWLPLLIGLCLMFGITAYPKVLIDGSGRADHLAVTLAGWAMAAGIVRGVGFVPRHRVLRWVLSATACVSCLLLAGLRLYLVRG